MHPNFSRPSAPLFPILSFGTISPFADKHHTSLLDVGHTLPVTTGRMGLALALEHMQVQSGDEILIPSYHCNAMVEPVVNAHGTPVFYKINEDASADIEDIERRLTAKTRALMVTHYFGFPQDIVRIKSFCEQYGLILIEDCAHLFFGEVDNKPIGSFGDYAFGSPMKFFPLYDGGYLIAKEHKVNLIPTNSSGWFFCVKGLATILGRSIEYKRFGVLRMALSLPFLLKDAIKKLTRPAQPADPAPTPTVEDEPKAIKISYAFDGYFAGLEGEFDPAWIHTRMSAVSRAIIRLTSTDRIFRKRQENYKTLLKALSDLPGSRVLYPVLPDSVAPYVFPLIVDDAERVFPWLKQQGVPISRFGEFLWKGMDKDAFPVSVAFSKKVMQFACHQELTQQELDRIISKVREALA